MVVQQILIASKEYKELDEYIKNNSLKKIFLVCDSSFPFLKIHNYFEKIEFHTSAKFIKFDNITPNPLYESVIEGVNIFRNEKCDSIIAVGGGSTIDVAKCIKLYSNMDTSVNYLKQVIVPNNIKLLAVPTTAGTGSEATRYAVIYYNGNKQSVSDDSCIPSAVLFDETALETLPEYQRKSTMMDALCHAVESYWSINSNKESQRYSDAAIRSILANKDAYLKNYKYGNIGMLKAANLAGKAINITQTTAGHAMCYKLTSIYGIAHGHAAALCVSKLFPFMADNIDKCIDTRGKKYLYSVFNRIAMAMNCPDIKSAVAKFDEIMNSLNLIIPETKEEDYEILKKSVNPERLKNNPVKLDIEIIDSLYHKILYKEQE